MTIKSFVTLQLTLKNRNVTIRVAASAVLQNTVLYLQIATAEENKIPRKYLILLLIGMMRARTI